MLKFKTTRKIDANDLYDIMERIYDVDLGYLVNEWRREEDLIAILNDNGDLTNGATTSDEGTEVGPYVVFRLENGNDVGLLILDKALEQ